MENHKSVLLASVGSTALLIFLTEASHISSLKHKILAQRRDHWEKGTPRYAVCSHTMTMPALFYEN